MATKVNEFLSDLDGGVLEEKLGTILSEVAGAVVSTAKTGRVILQLDLKQIGNSQQVEITHKLSYVRPTMKGKISEENTTATPMYSGPRGDLSLFPNDQADMFSREDA